MTADRVYRSALGMEEARAELRRCAGSQFDSRVVGAFLVALEREDREAAAPALAGGSDPVRQ
jgi:HD-GYP domain-containing protein (c-di-GMP phosphodiesterase class II)